MVDHVRRIPMEALDVEMISRARKLSRR